MPVHFSPSRSLKYWRMTLRTVRDSSFSRADSERASDLCLGCKGHLFFVFEDRGPGHELVEEPRHGSQLLGRGLQGVHPRAERRGVAQSLRVPPDVLARHAHAALVSIEGVQIVQVADENLVDL